MDNIKDRVKCVDIGRIRSSDDYEMNLIEVMTYLGYTGDQTLDYMGRHGNLIPRYVRKVNIPKFTGVLSASQFSSDLLESTEQDVERNTCRELQHLDALVW